ncbi:MAG: exodeoxyribonuclease VII small subunit [Kiritimatiellia bacterium]|jgi:exodeoxyribonuclease VII small subunit
MSNKQKILSFEQSLNNLEILVEALETGDLPLEEALSTFEQGIKLTKECQQQLSKAEQKVSLLVGENDDMHLVDFTNDAE